MKISNSITLGLLASLVLLFSACGESSNSGDDTQKDDDKGVSTTFTGYVVDAGVSGLDYKCSPSQKSGVTDINGTYTCEREDSVEFFLGTLSLGSVTAQEYITPSVLFPGDEEAALNFAQLLQSLDSDNNPSNGIEIDESLLQTLDMPIIFTNPTFDEDMQQELDKSNVTLVSEVDATEHLSDTFINLNIESDGTSPRAYQWIEGEWGECNGGCGSNNAVQIREVTCEDSQGTKDETQCNIDIKPETTQSCTASECETNPTPEPNTPTAEPTPTPTPTPTPKPDPLSIPVISSSQQAEFLNAINAARSEVRTCGQYGEMGPSPALSWNSKLYSAAYEHNYDMAKSNTFSHTGSGTQYDNTAVQDELGVGSSIVNRIEYYNYSWRAVGENIAAGQTSVSEVMIGWLNSEGHCKNIMNATFTEVGMSLYQISSGYRYYWTQNFGDTF